MDISQPIELAHLIDGRRVQGHSFERYYSPSDLSELVALVPSGDAAILDAAVSAAAAAQPGWAAASPEARSDCLERAATLLMARADPLGRLLAREEGKTFAEARGEVMRAGRIFRYFAGEALRAHGRSLASVRDNVHVDTLIEPLGVVGLITPWNFPIAIPAWKAAPALAFGNAVVMKAAANTSATASALADILVEAGIPNGAFNLIFVRGAIAGGMARDPRIAAISFTGSTGVGRGLAGDAVLAGKRLQLEMGGKNPLVVLDDADLDQAVAIALDGAFFQSGQRCTASSRLIVTDAIHDRFVDKLAERVAALRVGHALDPETQMGPVASAAQRETVEGYIESARLDGACIRAGGARVGCSTEGYFLAPTLITDTDAGMRVNREEIFGPVASVLRVDSFEDALAAANDTEFGLSAGIVTGSLKYAHEFRRRVQAGMVMTNLPTAGVDYHVPFGGAKASSFGPREQGFAAIDFYTRIKTSYTAH